MLLILPTFLLANAFARILVKSQHEGTQTKPKRNRLCFQAELVFSQPPLPSLPIGLSLTRTGESHLQQGAGCKQRPMRRPQTGGCSGCSLNVGPSQMLPAWTASRRAAPHRSDGWAGRLLRGGPGAGVLRRAGTGRGSRGSLHGTAADTAPPPRSSRPTAPGAKERRRTCPLSRWVFALKILNVMR